MAKNNDNMVDYLFNVGENVGDLLTVLYAFALSTVLSVTAGITILPDFNTVTASDGTTTTEPLFSLTDQFVAAGQTSITWAAAIAILAGVSGVVLTQGIEFFHPGNLRESDTLEEVLEWVIGVGTVGIPSAIAFDIGGIKSTVTSDPYVAAATFTVLVLSYVYLVDDDRWD